MEMDWKTNMAELGGAFMVSLLVLGESNAVMMGVLLAVTMAAMAGAHVLPMFTWISAMTGDLQDTDAWMGNVMRLVFQMLGACVAVVLMAEGGDVTAAEPEMWGFELWGPDAAEGAEPFAEANLAGHFGDIWNGLIALGNDPNPNSPMGCPSCVFENIQLSGT